MLILERSAIGEALYSLWQTVYASWRAPAFLRRHCLPTSSETGLATQEACGRYGLQGQPGGCSAAMASESSKLLAWVPAESPGILRSESGAAAQAERSSQGGGCLQRPFAIPAWDCKDGRSTAFEIRDLPTYSVWCPIDCKDGLHGCGIGVGINGL